MWEDKPIITDKSSRNDPMIDLGSDSIAESYHCHKLYFYTWPEPTLAYIVALPSPGRTLSSKFSHIGFIIFLNSHVPNAILH
jgi:hypothetical protein